MKKTFLLIFAFAASFAFCDVIDDEIASFDVYVPEIVSEDIDVETVEVQENVEVIEQVKVVDNVEVEDISDDVDYASNVVQINTINGVVQYDTDIYDYDSMLQSWKEIFSENKSYDLDEIKLNGKRKVICEARVSSNADFNVLIDNLAYYKKNGYDAVLLTFDGDSDIGIGLRMIDEIEKYGMKIWLAYAKSGNRFHILMDPEKLNRIISNFAPHCEVYVCGWLYTSVHNVEQPKEFMNYICKTLRSANESICIFGEIYRGNNSKNSTESTSIIDGLSGCTIVNFDKENTNRKAAIKYAKEKYGCDLVAVVCGIPGYLMNNPNGLSYRQNLKNHRILEIEFFTNGCVATMTFSDDGSDESYNRGMMDIARTPYFILESDNFKK